MSERLTALDNQTGVRPVEVRETWLQLMVKCVLLVTDQESNATCGMKKLAGGVESCIEGGIHAMYLLWKHHSQEEDWGFLLIDAWNAFNEDKRTAMLWYFQHEWPSGTQFTLNGYHHWAALMVQESEGSGHFLHSKEGVIQGDPLVMIEYGIGVLPLI